MNVQSRWFTIFEASGKSQSLELFYIENKGVKNKDMDSECSNPTIFYYFVEVVPPSSFSIFSFLILIGM